MLILRVPRAAIRAVDAYAEKQGVSRFDAINEAARLLRNSKGPQGQLTVLAREPIVPTITVGSLAAPRDAQGRCPIANAGGAALAGGIAPNPLAP